MMLTLLFHQGWCRKLSTGGVLLEKSSHLRCLFYTQNVSATNSMHNLECINALSAFRGGECGNMDWKTSLRPSEGIAMDHCHFYDGLCDPLSFWDNKFLPNTAYFCQLANKTQRCYLRPLPGLTHHYSNKIIMEFLHGIRFEK